VTIAATQSDITSQVVPGIGVANLRNLLLAILAEAKTAQDANLAEYQRASNVETGLANQIAALGTPAPATTTIVDNNRARDVFDVYWRNGFSLNRGNFTDLANLQAIAPIGGPGQCAVLDNGLGVPPSLAVWDMSEIPPAWIDTGAAVPPGVLALINAERTRAIGIESGLRTDLTQEVTDRTAAITLEVTNRNAAIAAAIAALINGAGASDDTLKELADKVAANLLADTSLGGRVATLETASTASGTRLTDLETFMALFATAGATNGQALVWNGTAFAPATISSGGGYTPTYSDGSIY
jgi:hypothetical protein